MLTRTHRQESLARAYVLAVAGQAGLNYIVHGYDYGLDISLRTVEEGAGRFGDGGFQLDLQLKSTTRANVGATQVTYDLEVKTYEDLRQPNVWCPRILVMLAMPDDESAWLDQSEDALALRHCAYWLSLRGRPATAATATVRISLPRQNVFSVPNLLALIERLRTGGEP